jgi:hypothetical protein
MRFLRLVRAVLREIFGEAAYDRFCAQQGLKRGRDSYARFLSKDDKATKLRCC